MAAVNNPFLSSPPASQANIVDLFGGAGPAIDSNQSYASKASDDLLQLGNPFADMFGSPAPPGASNSVPPASGNNMWMGNGSYDSFFPFNCFFFEANKIIKLRIQWICWKSNSNEQFICIRQQFFVRFRCNRTSR